MEQSKHSGNVCFYFNELLKISSGKRNHKNFNITFYVFSIVLGVEIHILINRSS